MEHEFVPGKRRCLNCRTRKADLEAMGITVCEFPDGLGSERREAAPAPEPEMRTPVWHLNVWTSVNGVIFTASAAAQDGPDINEKMTSSVLWAVHEIHAQSATPPEETE